MGRKGPKQTFYVCSAILNNKLISKTIESDNSEEAISLFEKNNGIKSQIIHGPFYKKRTGVMENITTIKYLGTSKRAIYNDWIVNALLLKEPENSALLLFDKRVDGKKMLKPTGNFVIQLDELMDLK